MDIKIIEAILNDFKAQYDTLTETIEFASAKRQALLELRDQAVFEQKRLIEGEPALLMKSDAEITAQIRASKVEPTPGKEVIGG